MASNAARRLTRELKQLEHSSNPQLVVRPSSDSLLVWHFVLHSLPEDTPFKDGCYHGKLVFPEDYPHAPPSLMVLTPNGRLEVNSRLCLSMTDFHPESWNPAWSIESILVGLTSFMVDESEPKGIGVVRESRETRERLGKASWARNATHPEFCELFPEFKDAESAPRATILPVVQEAADAAPESMPGGAALPVGAALPLAGPRKPDDAEASSAASSSAAVAPEAEADVDTPARLIVDIDTMERGEPQATPAQAETPESPPVSAAIPSVVSSSAEAQPAPAVAATGEQEEDLVPECWICREDASGEPLIQPCACTGSMSGVHASCVEQWIKTHRANARSEDLPHCSVCGEAYAGCEKRPGPLGFARHLCADFAQQAGRSTLLVGLLVAYWAAAQPDIVSTWEPGIWLRVVLLTVSGSFFAYKALVLVVSLPRGQPRPQNCLRIFHVSDFRLLAVHIAEAMATVVIAGLWCAYGQLPYYFFLPLCLLVVLPLINILLRHEHRPCSWRAVMVVVFIIGSPIIVMIHLGKLIWQNPKRLVDPLDGVVHVLVPVTAIPLCWFSHSPLPVVVLWGAHSVVLLVSVIEKGAIKRMKWKEGRIWWIAMQLSVLSAYIGNLLHSSSEAEKEGEKGSVETGEEVDHEEQILIFAVSLAWLGLVCCLVLQVNWGLCVEQYRAWQQRNGSFALSDAPARSPSNTASVSANVPEPQTIGTLPATEVNVAGSTGVVPAQTEV